MNENTNYFGIDISKDVFDVTGSDGLSHQFINDNSGFKSFMKLTTSNSHCVMESTGVYHLRLSYYLVAHQVKVNVENPSSVKRFIQMKLSKIKTDKSDSKMIYNYAVFNKLGLWTGQTKSQIECSHLLSLSNLFTKEIIVLKNKLHSEQAHGTYKGCPDVFTYNETEDHYVCPQGKVIPFKKVFYENKNNTKKKEYRGSKRPCIDCPIRTQCLGKSTQEKKFTVTYYRADYERNIARVNIPQGRYMKGKRQSTVEPVFGTLTQFMGLNKVNAIGIKQANKCIQLSAIAYNLKKYLKFMEKRNKSGAASQGVPMHAIKAMLTRILASYSPTIFA